MRANHAFLLVLSLAASTAMATAKNVPHEWSAGKVLDEAHARYYAGTYNNSSASTRTNGSLSGTANSSTIGNTTNTNGNGTYSENSTTSGSGFSTPIYKIYENLMIEGTDVVYVTSERLRWRWSKGAHVLVNGEVKYYVQGRKLHILDDDGKEHTVDILRQIKKEESAERPAPSSSSNSAVAPIATSTSPILATVEIESQPVGADIEIDGAFVGNTPSTLELTSGQHSIVLEKADFSPWKRQLNTSGGRIHISAELKPATKPS